MWFFTQRNLGAPPRPADGVWVGTERGLLVCGVCLYPTDGPYCVVEHSASDPSAPVRLRHAASVALIDGVRTYGALRSKNMLCFPRDKGILRLLEKGGFSRSPAVCVYHPPFNLTGFSYERKERVSSGGPSSASDDDARSFDSEERAVVAAGALAGSPVKAPACSSKSKRK